MTLKCFWTKVNMWHSLKWISWFLIMFLRCMIPSKEDNNSILATWNKIRRPQIKDEFFWNKTLYLISLSLCFSQNSCIREEVWGSVWNWFAGSMTRHLDFSGCDSTKTAKPSQWPITPSTEPFGPFAGTWTITKNLFWMLKGRWIFGKSSWATISFASFVNLKHLGHLDNRFCRSMLLVTYFAFAKGFITCELKVAIMPV